MNEFESTDIDLKEDDLGLGSEDGLLKEDLGFDDPWAAGGTPPIEKHGDLLKTLTDFEPIIRQIVNGWLGRVWDEATKGYTAHPTIKPIMNEKCALWCIGFLKTYARPTNIITNINKKEYDELHIDIIRVIWLGLATRDDFGIESSSDMYRIGNELEHSAILVLMGAGDGKYTKFLGESVNRQETVSYQGDTPMGAPARRNQGMLQTIKNKLMGVK